MKYAWVGFSQKLQYEETPICTSSHNFYRKDKAMINHRVGNSLMKPIYIDKLFNKRVIIYGLGSSLNDDNAIDTSTVAEGEKKTQEEEYVILRTCTYILVIM